MQRVWSILTDKLPTTITVEGHEYEIDTRTSTALNCIRKSREDIPQEVRMIYLLHRMNKDMPRSAEAVAEAVSFLAGPQTHDPKQEQKHKAPSYDWFQDAPLIFSAFSQTYSLSLDEITSMHWWRFLALFEGLPGDTRFMEVIRIRTMEIDPKEKAETRERKRRAKKAVALRDLRSDEERKDDVQRQFNTLGL
jgi:hypothetical protein